MKSMTGYGRHKEVINNRDITVEIKSVNHRYLDLTIKAPRIYGFLDDYIKKIMTKNVSRGKVDVYISIDTSKSTDTKIEINEVLLEEYLEVLRKTSEKYDLKDDITILGVTKLPDVVSIKKEEADVDEIIADVTTVLIKALEQYQNMRIVEGAELKKDFLLRKDNILEMTETIEKRSPQTVVQYRERLFAKLQEVVNLPSVTDERILLESAVFADKVSVTEETVRLRSHVLQLESMCELKEPIGRKLDFLIQEFNREANTIGSKASDSEIAKVVINLKGEIEKIREQVQNIE